MLSELHCARHIYIIHIEIDIYNSYYTYIALNLMK